MANPLPREFYIPKGAMKIADKKSDAVAYLREYQGPKGTRYQAVAFLGKSFKPCGNYNFQSAERRAAWLKEIFAGRQATMAYKAKRAAEKKAFVNPFKVGDLFRTCWGYDQTNVEYYEAVEIRGQNVIIREIAQGRKETQWLAGKCTPLPGQYIGEPMTKRAQEGGLRISSCQWASYEKPEMVAGVPVYRTASWSSYA